MDANDAVMDIGTRLEEARTNGAMCARLVVRNGEILLVGLSAGQDGDILIDHLSSKSVTYGPSTPKWKHIEDRIRELMLEGLL